MPSMPKKLPAKHAFYLQDDEGDSDDVDVVSSSKYLAITQNAFASTAAVWIAIAVIVKS